MKIVLTILILLSCSSVLYAKDEMGTHVCVPLVDMNYLEFQFQMRPTKGGLCEANEKELVIKRAENGLLEFLPPETNPSPSAKTIGVP